MNKHYGSPDSLPFDLRNRRFPQTYKLGPRSERVESETAALAARLKESIVGCLNAGYERVDTALSKMSGHSQRLIVARGMGEGFILPYKEGVTIAGSIDMAVSELLALGLVRFDYSRSTTDSHYYWTYLGIECAKRLGIR